MKVFISTKTNPTPKFTYKVLVYLLRHMHRARFNTYLKAACDYVDSGEHYNWLGQAYA